ncbi:hypothetical protein [Paenibacillus pseudetheri]|uniref:Uncharacterized protein n=1 Tax=Paenibacillus pseudetheri TaxID=2897682 RepID=A0ABN8FB83_9BACL|nr:hypothetical protein [Paenibacillus pseudetheri]CAH1054077.1 hypothetical protein PAECIP111894_00222 [Paenibacillus pseudetheri]
MNMTPERIEEHAEFVEKFGKLPGHMALELLAALEESQQQNEELLVIAERTVIPCHVCGEHVCDCNETYLSDYATGKMVVEYWREKERVNLELVEAQQTIARQREALKDALYHLTPIDGKYSPDSAERAIIAALGNKEGSDKA